ncbi:MAG: inorganic diphosphatase, partial [Christensenellales bacterium]
NYNYMFDISQLPEHLLDEIRHFFTVYKELEGRTTVVSKAQNREVANRVIIECINNYSESFGKKDKDKKNKDENKKGERP